MLPTPHRPAPRQPVERSRAEALKIFLVLDDHLTQTDEGRMAWMRELLERSYQTTQVIVMTCRPEHYGPSQSGTRMNTVVERASHAKRYRLAKSVIVSG